MKKESVPGQRGANFTNNGASAYELDHQAGTEIRPVLYSQPHQYPHRRPDPVYAIELFVNQYISFYLSLSRSALFAGQIWRLFTFVLVPFSGGGPLSVVLGIYFTWFVGSALEREWGDFRFNLYVLLGMAARGWPAC